MIELVVALLAAVVVIPLTAALAVLIVLLVRARRDAVISRREFADLQLEYLTALNRAVRLTETTDQALSKAQVWASEYLKREEKKMRADAIARSESVVKGKVAEQLVPFTQGFGYNPRDCRFLGSPLDFIVFDGLTEGELEQIIFIEVKTGLSRLSKREQQVRNVIDAGEVYHRAVRL